MSSYVASGYVAANYYTDIDVNGLSVDWLTFIITISQSYLTHIGGVRYNLDIEKLRNDLKIIESTEEGIAFPQTHNRNAPTTLSGVTYAQTLEVIAPYAIRFEDTGVFYMVSCSGANHNLGDITIFDGAMSMVIGNSAGLQSVNTGGGGGATASDVWSYVARTLTPNVPTAQENAQAVVDHPETLTTRKFIGYQP